MKKIFILLFVTSFILLGSYSSMATIVNSPDVGGFRTFQDLNTGRIWLDMDSFFGLSTTDMVAQANVAGFTFAAIADVEGLLNSLPLTGGEWASYKLIMGDAPNREIIWGSYFMSATEVGWAWGEHYWTSWSGLGSMSGWNYIPNYGTLYADMNIWAYQEGIISVPESLPGISSVPESQAEISSVPEPATMLLLGSGLLGLFGLGRKFRK